MGPPLIGVYKIWFAVKRILQTWLGGPRLVNVPAGYICIQVFLFATPAIVLSLVNIFPNYRLSIGLKALIIGFTLLSLDLALCVLFSLLKRIGGGSGRKQIRPGDDSGEVSPYGQSQTIPTTLSNFNVLQEEDFVSWN